MNIKIGIFSLYLMGIFVLSQTIFARSPWEQIKAHLLLAHADHTILTPSGQPTVALLKLLALLSIPHDGSLPSIVHATQKAWLRKLGTERWHMQEIMSYQTSTVRNTLKDIGCIEEALPQQENYDYALVLGGAITRMRIRLAYLIKLWNKGIRCNSIVLLGSARPRDSSVESDEIVLNNNVPELPCKPDWQFSGSTLPKTEHDMMLLILAQTELPEGMQHIPIKVINTPMLLSNDGIVRRPETAHVINSWLATKPKPGTCLCLSNQPYVGHQDATIRSLIPESFMIDTVGATVQPQEKVAVILDALARWLYQEQIRRNNKKSTS